MNFAAIATFLLQTERIYPEPAKFRRPEDARVVQGVDRCITISRSCATCETTPEPGWSTTRAPLAPISGLSREERKRRCRRSSTTMMGLARSDPPGVRPLAIGLGGEEQITELASYLPGGLPRRSETVQVRYPSPQRVEIEATLERPGLVVLADVYYPGWELTIDGKPAPIYRVNRLMRGAAVSAGKHHLVYTYAPESFRVGGMISLAGLGLLALLGVACTRRPVDPPSSRPPPDPELPRLLTREDTPR